ncbi:MAG: peptidoglycan editing factor PgeF [Lachnospiraceae bacterium]|nr:peptidoglycan editing factor PgeF [Lachnospiraceae bacterium]MBQ4069022.1 peptidoglycan editing factor PgeF [Lachnospiraceae bacterium]
MDIIRFDKLNNCDIIEHGFSTRVGGVSKGIFESMNLGFNRGDDDENVKENFRIISKELNMPYENLVLSAQTHTTNIRIVTEADKGKGIVFPKDYDDIDGLITNVKQIPLVTFYADCVPLLFFDPVKEVIATSHSGWRGTVNRMGKVTVEKMVEVYGCKPENIIACIGPSICKDCYEVSADVAEAFMEEFKEGYKNIVFSKQNDKYLIDLWEANRVILKMTGITEENLEISGICTCCNSDLLFSHRASGGKRGNLAAFIMLK